jgi:hypothetical protein
MLPRLLPDELLLGYKGRVLWLHRTTDFKALIRQLAHDAGWNPKDQPTWALVARLNRMSLLEMVQRHTYWPLLMARPPKALKNQVDEVSKGISRVWPLESASRRGTWLCPQCVVEDMEFWRFAYWRRSHHTPGAVRCPKHRCALVRVGNREAFLQLPHHFEHLPTAVDEDQQTALDNAVVQRCVDTFDLLAELPGYLDQRTSCAMLELRAGGSRVRGERYIASERLTDMARCQLPEVWLDDALRWGIAYSEAYLYGCLHVANPLIGIRIAPLGLIIAAALLHESAEEAAGALAPHLVTETVEAPRGRPRVRAGSKAWYEAQARMKAVFDEAREQGRPVDRDWEKKLTFS